MSLTLYNSIGWAVEKQTIAAGGGLTGPVLVSAASTDPNTVRLTFDRRLMLEYRQQGVYRAGTLDLTSFQIVKISDSTPLIVVRTVWIDDTHIDLLTENQDSANYRVTTVAGGVMDFWGNTISTQTADFLGQQKSDYLTPGTTRSFTSGYGGMQENEASDVYPDLAPPYLTNQDPAPSAGNVSRYTNLLLDLLDDYTGVDLSTVRIWVGGVLAYRGDTDTFLAPFDGSLSSRTAITKGHRFVIDNTGVYSEYTLVLVEVYAYDLAGIPNLLSTSYSFRTVDESAPYIDPATQDPPAGSVDAPIDTDITIDILDTGAGVDAATVWIKVNGAYAWLSGAPQTGFSVTKTTITGGYRYVIDPDSNFNSYQVITVDVHASDLSSPANTLNTTYTFRTEDVESPYISYRHPTQGDTDVPVWHEVNITVVDTGSGVDASTVVITVAGVVAWSGDTYQPGFEGSTKTTVSGGFAYVIQHVTPFLVSTAVTVEIVCDDISGNTLDTSYSFDTETGATPRIEVDYPAADQVNVEANVELLFEVTDAVLDLDPSTVLCIINDVIAYQNETERNGFTVARTAILGGYEYSVTPPIGYTYGSTVTVFLFAEDYSHAHTSESFTFDIMLSPDCFTGPLNTFEEKVVVPFTADVHYLELIRYGLIQNFVKINPITATRAVFLQGQTHELAIILRDLVPTPTATEAASLLCKRRSLLTVANLLPDKEVWLEGCVSELAGLGVPIEHRQLIKSYIASADEIQLVLLMCFVTLLAKALE